MRAHSSLAKLWESLRLRTITALVFAVISLTAFIQGGALFFLFVAVVSVLVAFEWVAMVQKQDRLLTSLILSAFLFLMLMMTEIHGLSIGLEWAALMGLLAIITCLYIHQKIAVILGGYVYFAAPMFSLLVLREAENGMWLIVYLVVTVWLTDIFAMFAGKTIGGAKLAPIISPNKTWAGLFGGMAAAVVGGVVFSIILDISPYIMALVSALVAVVAQAGDLFESAIKRRHKVKNSGSLLPGHGGFLDRVDGLLIVLIVVFVIIYSRRQDDVLSASALFIW